MKKIYFISPRRPDISKSEKIKKCFEECSIQLWHAPPLGLLTIAGYTPSNYEISYTDEDFEEIDFNSKADIIAVSAMTQQAFRAYEIADAFKEKGKYTVIGGIHSTVLPYEALEHFNTVFKGEGEEIWLEFLEDFEAGIPKDMYSSIEKPPSLQQSKLPLYSLLKGKHFEKSQNSSFNMVPVQATRGCPHDCSFCSVSKIQGKAVRKKTVENVIAEIRDIKKNLPGSLIMFADDNLFVDKNFCKTLLKELIKEEVNWVGQTDISIADNDELLELAYKSGCICLLIGLESLNDKNLENINHSQWKKKRRDTYESSIRKMQSYGIIPFLSFIVGMDGDSEQTFDTIIAFCDTLHCNGQFTVLTPLPGTELYKSFKEQDRLISGIFWDKCNFFDVVFKPKGLSESEIENGLIRIYQSVFSKESLIKRLMYMKKKTRELTIERWEQ